MCGGETRFYHQAAATAKPHLNPSVEPRRCLPLSFYRWDYFYRYELSRTRFAQPLLPGEKLPALQASFMAKGR
jgi:hypothetical protein